MSLLLNSFDWKVAKLNMNIIICEISLCLFKMINKEVDFEIVFTHFYSKSSIERVFVWFLCSSIEKRKMNQIFVLNLVLSECSFEFLVLLFFSVDITWTMYFYGNRNISSESSFDFTYFFLGTINVLKRSEANIFMEKQY